MQSLEEVSLKRSRDAGCTTQPVIITCYEKWDLTRLEHIKTLNLPIEIRRTLDIHVEPNAPRIRVNYSTGKGDAKGRVYGKIVYHSEHYKRRKLQETGAYIYESDDHPLAEDTAGGDSLQRLCGWVRRHIAHEFYRDYDISNCAPTLLEQILKQYGLCPRELSEYNVDRDALFQKYNYLGIPGVIKKSFLVVLHMGSADPRIPETIRLRNALRASLVKLATLNADFKALYARCEVECAREVKKKKNLYLQNSPEGRKAKSLGKFCAIVWNREEHRVLMSMRRYFSECEGYDRRHMVLCFDGIMLEKKPVEVPVNFEALSAFVMQETGFRVKVEEKSMLPNAKYWALYNGEIPVVYKEKQKF